MEIMHLPTLTNRLAISWLASKDLQDFIPTLAFFTFILISPGKALESRNKIAIAMVLYVCSLSSWDGT